MKHQCSSFLFFCSEILCTEKNGASKLCRQVESMRRQLDIIPRLEKKLEEQQSLLEKTNEKFVFLSKAIKDVGENSKHSQLQVRYSNDVSVRSHAPVALQCSWTGVHSGMRHLWTCLRSILEERENICKEFGNLTEVLIARQRSYADLNEAKQLELRVIEVDNVWYSPWATVEQKYTLPGGQPN